MAAGFLIARLMPKAVPNSTQRQLDNIQERFDSYQSEVVTHFNSTAVLVKKLTPSYQEVQDHRAEGANLFPAAAYAAGVAVAGDAGVAGTEPDKPGERDGKAGS